MQDGEGCGVGVDPELPGGELSGGLTGGDGFGESRGVGDFVPSPGSTPPLLAAGGSRTLASSPGKMTTPFGKTVQAGESSPAVSTP